MAKKAKKKKAKKKTAAEKKKAREAKHEKDYEGDICQGFKRWYDDLVEKGQVKFCLRSTWVRRSGSVVNLCVRDVEFRANRRALELGIEARSKYHLSDRGGGRLLIDLPWLLIQSRRAGLIEDGLEIIRRKKAELQPPPGVISGARARFRFPPEWKPGQVVEYVGGGKFGAVREEGGGPGSEPERGIRWVTELEDAPGVFTVSPLCTHFGPEWFEGQPENWRIRAVNGSIAQEKKDEWNRLKKAGRLKVEE